MILSVLLFTFVFLMAPACKKDQPAATEPKGYQLVWSDEFNTDGPPNPSNWRFENGFVRNEELQWYQPDNAFCENGFLIIEGKRERKPNPNYRAGSGNWKENRPFAEYTSSSLLTRGLFQWQFGRFEMRAKIDTRAGLWPAFWTLGVSGEWPHCGEVDIMEFYQGKILANVAWGAEERWQAVWDGYRRPITEFGDPDWSQKFHVWRMDWDEENIFLYVDDELLNATSLKQTVNRDAEKKNPFLQPHYIIVNLAIGGTAGGDPSHTAFPSRYEIDYVRVYQK
ncbi:glycoside hydrolase family 16 protein [candidate division KSB1 bacterium]|nr:glycoside hydrolase family 16 protein [candidate division KSB1 bacterium]